MNIDQIKNEKRKILLESVGIIFITIFMIFLMDLALKYGKIILYPFMFAIMIASFFYKDTHEEPRPNVMEYFENSFLAKFYFTFCALGSLTVFYFVVTGKLQYEYIEANWFKLLFGIIISPKLIFNYEKYKNLNNK